MMKRELSHAHRSWCSTYLDRRSLAKITDSFSPGGFQAVLQAHVLELIQPDPIVVCEWSIMACGRQLGHKLVKETLTPAFPNQKGISCDVGGVCNHLSVLQSDHSCPALLQVQGLPGRSQPRIHLQW